MKNKEGLWKFSPSGLYTYEECPACFWVEQHLGRAPSIPMRLNDAMDEKLKNRYDGFRKKGELPPEIADYKGKLFEDLDVLNEWRNNKKSLQYINEKDGYVLAGKLDEVFVSDKGEMIVADYKSSGDEPKPDKQKYYRLQLHAYTFMIKEKGYKVGDEAYLIHYFTKDRTDPSMNMEFDCHLDRVEIDLDYFEKKLREMAEFLDKDFPGADNICKKCLWQEKRANV